MRENKELKYNFVFFFANCDFWKAILGTELYNSENSRVYKYAFEGNKFLQFLFRIHWSYKINNIIELPFKSLWFKKMYNQNFNNDLPLCFVYMGGNNIRFDGGFTDYVKKRSSKNRQVILHNDLIAKKCNYDYSIIRNKVDLATTYDLDEAKKYGLPYFQETTYSKLIEEPDNVNFEYDVYFLAAAKDRLPMIYNVYNKLTSAGVKCKFQITGVAPEDQISGEGLEFISILPYEESLKNIIKSKCVLEIIQGGSADITTRVLEAIAYKRRLLTNCQMCNNEFFNEGQLQVFENADDIDIDFILAPLNPDEYEPKLDMNPFNRLYFIQDELESKENEQV